MKYCLLTLAILMVAGCYTEKRAQREFNKAALSFPVIPAEYCASAFAPRDSHVRDTLVRTDTLIMAGEQFFDTTYVDSTGAKVVTRTLPGKVIIKTVQITDTVWRENTAAVKACELTKNILVRLADQRTAEMVAYKNKAQRRGTVMWSLLGLILVTIIGTIYLKLRKL